MIDHYRSSVSLNLYITSQEAVGLLIKINKIHIIVDVEQREREEIAQWRDIKIFSKKA